jgi:hypothetical protein
LFSVITPLLLYFEIICYIIIYFLSITSDNCPQWGWDKWNVGRLSNLLPGVIGAEPQTELPLSLMAALLVIVQTKPGILWLDIQDRLN